MNMTGVRQIAIRERPRILAYVALAIALLLLLCAPLFFSPYKLFQFASVAVAAIAIFGLNILTGYTGQMSIGHGAFYAIGAYAAAILITKEICPYWLAVFFAAAVCFIVGLLFGLPVLRLQGHYLALATFALGVTVPQIIQYRGFESYTGGFQGLLLEKPPVPFGLPLTQDQWLYFFCVGIAVGVFVVGRNILRGQVGRRLVAVRDNPTAAIAMGINPTVIKSFSFALSAMFTGLAGALSAVLVQFVSPDGFGFLLSITLLVGVIVGGIASLSGAFYGALFVTFVPNIAASISKALPWAIFGFLIVASMYVAPNGAAGLVGAMWKSFCKRFP